MIRSLGVLACIGLLACSRDADRATPTAAVPLVTASASALLSTTAAPPAEPATLLTVGVSAYAAEVAIDDEAVYLLTRSAAYRLVPGRPPERWPLDLGISPALAGEHLVYWSKGAIRRAPKRGGAPEIVAKVARQPQRLSSSGEHFAWVERAEDGHFTLWTLDGSRARELLTPAGYVAALTLLDDQLFFVEQLPGPGYRLGVVPLSGAEPRYAEARKGRSPAMLAAAREIFYYDGPSLTVRRASPDLEGDRVISRGVICSPIAAAERLYCAQPAGLLELPLDGGKPRALSLSNSGAITKVAASPSRVAWLVDAGADELTLRTLALP